MDYLNTLFAAARVLVVGDVMLDRYWHGNTARISPEAPVPIVRIIDAGDERPGGAANVALNIRSLGAAVTLIGLTGKDDAAHVLKTLLNDQDIDDRLLQSPDMQTIVKLRVLSQHQQLIRLDFEDGNPHVDWDGVRSEVAHAMPDVQAMVLSDYAKGCLADPAALIALARKAGRPVVADPKGVDFSRYRGATVITPNLKEFEAVVGVCGDDATIERHARELCVRHQFEAVLVTRGEHGMALVPAQDEVVLLPARTRDVYDVTGAGDTVCAVLAAALAAGKDLLQAIRFANAAAGIVVGKLGAATVTTRELEAELHGEAQARSGVLNETELIEELRGARLRGERIVMTNGCFDILHAGHVQYLAKARQHGDRLIVAVNDDDSVRRLKGDGRPINKLAQRMQVLAALSAVDWVVPFTEDTPERLINRVLPEVLVKGGDYRPEEVAGGGSVRAHGGQVVILDYVPGCSSSDLIGALSSAPTSKKAGR